MLFSLPGLTCAGIVACQTFGAEVGAVVVRLVHLILLVLEVLKGVERWLGALLQGSWQCWQGGHRGEMVVAQVTLTLRSPSVGVPSVPRLIPAVGDSTTLTFGTGVAAVPGQQCGTGAGGNRAILLHVLAVHFPHWFPSAIPLLRW